jgi:enoyl-[acyl-carrier protein] reductase III
MNNPFRLDDQFVLVTGGTRGIGRAIALQFARAGAKVVANYVRNDAAAEDLRARAVMDGLDLQVLRADLTLPKGIEAVKECMEPKVGCSVSIVHCAATGIHRPFEQLTLKHWDWTMSLNVRAFFDVVHTLLPVLRSGSSVVAVSSAGAVRAVPAYAAVGSSKGALESLARHLAVELAPRGVRVNILSPGSVMTKAWEAFPDKEQRLAEAVRRAPRGRLATEEEVANAVHFLCSPAAAGIVGHTLVVDGGARVLE